MCVQDHLVTTGSSTGWSCLPPTGSFLPSTRSPPLRAPSADGTVCIGDTVLSIEDDELVTTKLIVLHIGRNGEPVRFDLCDKSEGTVRLLDLLPHLLEAEETDGLAVVADTSDRSLQTQIFEGIRCDFLKTGTPESRRQFVFTTSDVNLLTQETFRRDELWVVDKRPSGESSLCALAEVKGMRRPSRPNDFRKLCVEGALGNVPPSR